MPPSLMEKLTILVIQDVSIDIFGEQEDQQARQMKTKISTLCAIHDALITRAKGLITQCGKASYLTVAS